MNLEHYKAASEHTDESERLLTPPFQRSPFVPLHPTLKACKCGAIGTKAQFYRHIKLWREHYATPADFFANHGEVPLRADDPRTQLSAALALILEHHESAPTPE